MDPPDIQQAWMKPVLGRVSVKVLCWCTLRKKLGATNAKKAIGVFHANKTDEEGPPRVQNHMETLMDKMQASQDTVTGSRGNLPSLGNHHRGYSNLDPFTSSGLLTQRSNCLPVLPTHRHQTRNMVNAASSSSGLLSLAVQSKLSQSAPRIIEPLLCANYVLQARAHIQTRLGSHEPISQQKGPILDLQTASPLRTPNQLAPLDLRQKDNRAAPVQKQSVPLKPISKGPVPKIHLRRRFARGTPPTSSITTMDGSEDSGSNSSSQSRTVLIDDDYERLISEDIPLVFTEARDLKHPEEDLGFCNGKTGQGLKAMPKTLSVSLMSIQLQGPELVNCMTLTNCKNAIQHHNTRPTNTVKTKIVIPSNSNSNTNDRHKSVNQADSTCERFQADKPATLKDLKTDEVVSCKTKGAKLNTSSALRDTPLKCSVHNKSADLKRAKLKKGITKESSAHCKLKTKLCIDRLNLNKAAKKLSLSNQSREIARTREQIAEEDSDSFVKSKLKPVIKVGRTTNALLACMKGTNSAHSRKANPDKVCKSRAQQSPAYSELKSARKSNSPEETGPQRLKSALDFITYKDMFTTIQNEADGPAIYEMFAGPIYDHLRNPISCQNNQWQPVPSRKSHQVKCRSLKQVQINMRNPTEATVVSTKAKVKLLSSWVKPRLIAATKAAHKKERNTKLETTSVFSNDGEIHHGSLQKSECAMINIGEEVLPGQKSEKIEEESTCTIYGHLQIHMEEGYFNSSAVKTQPESGNQTTTESSKDNQVPATDTWTSFQSSGPTDMSVVYKKFLDDVGDGPLTDDLLQRLAEELSSLDAKDISVGPCPQNLEMEHQKGGNHMLNKNNYPGTTSMTLAGLHKSGLGDNISWTKGEVLGRGAYGTVYCGLTNQGQLIAVKQVTLKASDPEVARRQYNRLQREVELLKTLSHANIVGFLGTSFHQHMASIFMEYIPGGSIASILHRFGPLPERIIGLYTYQILKGVAYLHLNRVIHRDLKGNNVMLMPTGVIKLIDFGCARRISCVSHTTNNSGELLKSVCGTPYWMAPEVINETGYDRKSDIWSVGCTVFEMATGKPPLAHMDKIAALFYIGGKKGFMPSLPEEFSKSAKEFVSICLTSDQTLRPCADQLLQHSFILRNRAVFTTWKAKKTHFCRHSDGLCG
ncbi:mitogen-activated protein kinase kinase kinase 19 [Corythoichthys intestinalis]|uniref:mitogen-activated protein kinase kinase kinase 19 n=1 Tax=Corythoichthys intestinalis TaxID=161448 RepID=UPI0025A64684|nr:mitogen-activated protein kinase kinase kinase 19 [Corythoichthys intestinalis]